LAGVLLTLKRLIFFIALAIKAGFYKIKTTFRWLFYYFKAKLICIIKNSSVMFFSVAQYIGANLRDVGLIFISSGLMRCP